MLKSKYGISPNSESEESSNAAKKRKTFFSSVAVKVSKAVFKKLQFLSNSTSISKVAGSIIRAVLSDERQYTLNRVPSFHLSNAFNTEVRISNRSMSSSNMMSNRNSRFSEKRFMLRLEPWLMKVLFLESSARGLSRPALIAKILELETESVIIPSEFKPRSERKMDVATRVNIPITSQEYAGLKGSVYVTRTKSFIQKIQKNINRLNPVTLKRCKIPRKSLKMNSVISIENKSLIRTMKRYAESYDCSMGDIARACIFMDA